MNKSIVIISCSKQIDNSLQAFLMCDKREKRENIRHNWSQLRCAPLLVFS